MEEARPLSELIPGYPEWAPDTLSQLANLDGNGLRAIFKDNAATDIDIEMIRGLRLQLIRDRMAGTQKPRLASVEAADLYLRNLWLRPSPREWYFVALDADRRQILEPRWERNDDGKVRIRTEKYVKFSKRDLPDPDDLKALPKGGTWLLIYGQSPDVLQRTGTVDGLRKLGASVPVADVLFQELLPGGRRHLFSLRERIGAFHGPTGWEVIDFPDIDLRDKVREAFPW